VVVPGFSNEIPTSQSKFEYHSLFLTGLWESHFTRN
jgi:hypothetical protein